MTNLPDHPITTPKGAAAVSIVLAVVGVFTPFIFDLGAALAFAALCIAVVVWIYGSELRRWVTSGSWTHSLLIPLASLAAIAGMAGVSATSKKPAPPAAPAINADELTRRMDTWFAEHQVTDAARNEDRGRASPQPLVIDLRDNTPVEAPGTPLPRAVATNNEFDETLRRLTERNRLRTKESECLSASYKVSGALIRLINEAVNYQNGWAYSRNDRELLSQYTMWSGAVGQALKDNKEVLTNTKAFTEVKELPTQQNLLVASNVLGSNVWANFDAKRKALNQVRTDYEANVCITETAAVKAFDDNKRPSSAGTQSTPGQALPQT